MSNKKNRHISGNPEKAKLQEMIAEEFKISHLRCTEIKDIQAYYYLEKQVRERRRDAIIQYMPYVVGKFGKKLSVQNIHNLFIRFCCSPSIPPRSIGYRDSKAYWSVAAAVWILDELKFTGMLSQLNLDSYHNPENFTVQMPELIDSVYLPKLLKAMVTLIQMQMIGTGKKRLMFHSLNADYGKKELKNDIKSHMDFLSILKLLDSEHVQSAVKNLEKKMWAVIDTYLESMSLIDGKCSHFEYETESQQIPLEIQYCTKREDLLSSNYPDAVAECLAEYSDNFQVENPYEMCFAIFYMIAAGNNLAWLYTPLLPILKRCWQKFSWNENQAEFEYNLNDEEESTEISIKEPNQGYSLNTENLNRKVYTLTKTLLPRNIVWSKDSTESEFSNYFIELASAYHDCMIQQTELHQQEIEKILQHKTEVPVIITKQDSVDLQELNSLKAENTALSKRLKEERHKSSILEKEITELKQKNQDEYEELLLYREYMYYLEHDEEEEMLKDIPVKFPYHTKRKIVCLGGIEPWLKHISEKLKNVTFQKQNVKTNIDTFKYADEIWIQMEGLKHKESLPVTNLAKKGGIPIHFFRCAGVGQCAEQFARHDMNRK